MTPAEVQSIFAKIEREAAGMELHNPDVNPNWRPLMAQRVYACDTCQAETTIPTNHTGKTYGTRCAGKCRTIYNPHTAREIVAPHYGPHHYVRDADGTVRK